MGAIRAGDYEEAVSRFAKGSQINPRHSLFYFFTPSRLRSQGARSSQRPRFERGLALEPGFRIRIFSEFGMASPIAEKFAEGARLLGLPE